MLTVLGSDVVSVVISINIILVPSPGFSMFIPACREVILKDQVQKRSKDAALGYANISSGESSVVSTSTYWVLLFK